MLLRSIPASSHHLPLNKVTEVIRSMKKFLAFFSVVIILFGAVGGLYLKYIHQSEYNVFIESYSHGKMTLEGGGEKDGTAKKFRVTCKKGKTVTVKIAPERTKNAYYDLAHFTVNGVDLTDEVKDSLEYEFTVEKKTNIVATFKKGKKSSGKKTSSSSSAKTSSTSKSSD